jgi:hypothetical protein
MRWRRSQMGVLILAAQLNSSSGADRPFPKDVLWERSWTRAIRRSRTLLFVFLVVSGCRVS